MIKFVLAICLFHFLNANLQSQVSVTSTAGNMGPSAYSTIKDAFDAINSGTHLGTITIEITGNTTETTTAVLNASEGTSSYTSILVNPGGGTARLISGAIPDGSPLIDLNGADNVTFDGLNTGGNSLTISNTTISDFSGTSTIRFQGDATGNMITRCSILGSAAMANGIEGGVIWFGSAGITTGNDNNTISNCDIGPAGINLPSKSIYFSGTSDSDPGTANSGITITNNNIFDFFSSVVSSSGIDLNSGTVGTTISNNKFYQTGSRTQSAPGLTHRPVNINNLNGNNFQITGNTIGFASSAGTGIYTFVFAFTGNGSFIPIYLSVGTAIASGVQGNTIAGIAMSGAASGTSTLAPFRGIHVNTGLTTIGDVTGNTIGSQSATESITFTTNAPNAADAIGIFNLSQSSNWTTHNNLIGGIKASNSTASAANIYGLRCNASSSLSWSCLNNTIGGNVANSIQNTSTSLGAIVNGILNSNSSATITGNLIRNMTSAGGQSSGSSSAISGIVSTASSAAQTISQNTIFNLSSAGNSSTMNGIIITSGTTVTISDNTINTLSGSGLLSPVLHGIMISGGTTVQVSKNKIFDLLESGAVSTSSPKVNGILLANGATVTVYNNLIGDLRATSANLTDAIRGISVLSATPSSTYNVYYNTVYINAVSSGANFGTTGIFHSSSTIPTEGELNLRNNIIVNTSTANGSGRTVAYRRSNSTLTNYAATSNNNLFYAGAVVSPNFIFHNGVGSQLDTFKTLVAPRDAASVTETVSATAGVFFQSFTGSNAGFLHMVPGLTTQVESGAINIASLTDDYDDEIRQGNSGYAGSGIAPDIGADEFTGVDLSGPSISYALQGNTACTLDRMISATITGGVDSTAGTKPRLYFKKSGDMNTYAGNTSADNGWKYVEATNASSPFSFTTNYTLFQSPIAVSDVIQYFVIAQDLNVTPNISLNSGIFNAPPTSVNLVAGNFPITGTINSYTIYAPLSGTVTIGAAGSYTSLTGAGGLFSDINSKGLSGDLLAQIVDPALTENGTNMLNAILTTSCSGGPYTLTIKPTVVTTLSGNSGGSSSAIIRLIGADNVIINGSIGSTPNTVCPNSAASRDMTIKNNSTNANSAVIWIQHNVTNANAATNNSVMNCNLIGNSNTTTLFGAISGGSVINTSSAGNGNNNNSFINNNISKTQYGIYSQGGSLFNKNEGTIINQNLINTVSPDNVSKGGIWTGFENNITISGNSVSEISQIGIQDVFGITLGVGTTMNATSLVANEVTNATVTKNVIGKVVNTGSHSAADISVALANSGTNLIANNMISGVIANGTSLNFAGGIVLGGGTGSVTQVYYNTVSMQGTITGASAATQTSACLAVVNSTPPALDSRNNIYTNTQIGNSGATLRFASLALGYSSTTGNYSGLTSDHNDFYSAGAGPGTYVIGITGGIVSGTSRSTLTDWTMETGRDGGGTTVNILPVFYPFPDLHIDESAAPNLPLNDGAVSIGVVTDDIDCELRMTDMGADEFASSCTNIVTTTNDSGGGSLRDVIACATGGSTITFHPLLTGSTIILTGEIIINKNLTILGPGISGLTISVNTNSRLFHLLTGNTLTLEGMSLKDANPATNGGAIFVEGNLILENLLLQNNKENGVPKALTVIPTAMVTINNNVFMNQ